ncbi:MAG: sigma-70 family RNA polymerase sigma factor [Planctomycetota bacterium]
MDSALAAFDRLVAEHQRSVLRVCRAILGDEHLGADAAQETFVRLWRRLGAERRPERLDAWLRRVAVTAALDLRRRRAAREEALARAPRREEAAERPPEEGLAARELAERLARALERLPEGQRVVFQLRHSAGLSLAEVAATLGVSLPTVKTQFARACVKLHGALRPFDPQRNDSP